jgi:DnaJ-class molecular chaperone
MPVDMSEKAKQARSCWQVVAPPGEDCPECMGEKKYIEEFGCPTCKGSGVKP